MRNEKGVQRKTNVAGVLFAHAELSDCGEHALELEIENFPLPGSLSPIGCERGLISLGVERGRLPPSLQDWKGHLCDFPSFAPWCLQTKLCRSW